MPFSGSDALSVTQAPSAIWFPSAGYGARTVPRGLSWTKLSSCSTVAGGTSSPYWIATPPCSRLWTSCAWLTGSSYEPQITGTS